MKFVDCEQRTPEWFEARLGKPSSSSFEKLITPTGKPVTSAKSETYINTLIAEKLTGKKEETHVSQWMQRGIDLEPQARSDYEFLINCVVEEVGFCLHDDIDCGCSPDGLVVKGENKTLVGNWWRGVEIKCPAPTTHASYLIDHESLVKKYYPQVQGCMWITDLASWDLIRYNPEMKHVLVNVKRDDDYIQKLETEVHKAVDIIKREVERLQ